MISDYADKGEDEEWTRTYHSRQKRKWIWSEGLVSPPADGDGLADIASGMGVGYDKRESAEEEEEDEDEVEVDLKLWRKCLSCLSCLHRFSPAIRARVELKRNE